MTEINNIQLTVTIKEVYGKKTVYPACETSKTLARLSGHKTLTEASIKLIRTLGYNLIVNSQTL